MAGGIQSGTHSKEDGEKALGEAGGRGEVSRAGAGVEGGVVKGVNPAGPTAKVTPCGIGGRR